MTNEQITETKKWNKLSIGVFCATVINFSFVFLGVKYSFINESLIFVSLFINILLTIISIFGVNGHLSSLKRSFCVSLYGQNS